MARKSAIAQAASSVTEGREKAVKREWTAEDLVPSGSTMLNLACSDTIHGAFLLGGMINIIGDSAAGKTIEALTICAECNQLERFDDYRLIFDDIEHRNNFDMQYMFGEELCNRLESPAEDSNGDAKPSATVQEVHHNILNAIEGDKPFIYIADSWDALDSIEDQAKVDEMRDALVKEKEAKGSYGMAKAKAGSAILKNISGKLAKTRSLLIIVSQTRDNIDPLSFQKKTRSGGKALKFYANHEIWAAGGKKIKAKDLVIGVDSIWKISKNSASGKQRDIKFPIYYDYGVDDLGSCIEFLLEVKHWSKSGLKINPGNDLSCDPCTKAKLIATIEENGWERILKRVVGKVWAAREEAVKTNRKRKY